MNRLTKINLIVFGILSLVSIISILVKDLDYSNVFLMGIILVFNLSLGILVILMINSLINLLFS